MYIRRNIEPEILDRAKFYPVITITGPRQSGKTTLAKHLFNKLPYYSLEDPDIRFFAENDPRAFLKQFKKGAILDEVQNVPQLLSYLQQIVDENRDEILFVLTGSNQFSMMNKITQSLAGRTALLKLLPFSFNESPGIKDISTNEILLEGFYPLVQTTEIKPYLFYQNYYETYLERDVRQLIQVKDLSLFQKFIKLCAGRVGNLYNASSLASDAGVAVNTVRSWISILEASYILYRLVPYYENINKRLIKSPKLYFYDTGLAAYLLGIENTTQMSRDPLRGALFENMIINEFLKNSFNSGLSPDLYFYRDSNHFEIDLIRKSGHELTLYEIKSAQTFHPDFLKGLKRIKKTFGERIKDMYLIYDGDIETKIDDIRLLNFRSLFLNHLSSDD